MICAIHQPQYLPWLGYFNKMARSDVFVLLDDVQFKKNEWQNRNRIRTPQGCQWLTVPVLHDFRQNINEVRLNSAVHWQADHLKALEMNYKKAPFFADIMVRLAPFYGREWKDLSELNTALVRELAVLLGIKTRILLSSEMGVSTVRTERLVEICSRLNTKTYLAGAGCSAYMDENLFRASGMDVIVQDYHHPEYPQLWGNETERFVSHLSVVDLLFNCGPRSGDVLL